MNNSELKPLRNIPDSAFYAREAGNRKGWIKAEAG